MTNLPMTNSIRQKYPLYGIDYNPLDTDSINPAQIQIRPAII